MNINIPLIGKIIGSCLFSAASIVSVVNFKPPEEKTNEPVVEETTNQIDNTIASEHKEENRSDSKEDVNASQESGQESGQGSTQSTTQVNTQVNTQVKSATKTAAKTTAKPVSAPKTTAPAQTQPKQKQYTSVYEFEHAMLGKCPQNVPAGVWPDKLRPIVSLGYRPEEKYGPSSLETTIAIYWSSYKQGRQGSSFTFTGGLFGGDCSSGANNVKFTVSFANNTVNYTPGGYISPSGEQWAKSLAQRGQSYLQSISSQFRSKCGY